MSKQQMSIIVTSRYGSEVFYEADFEGCGEPTVIISVKAPDRSPLHEKALNLADLKVGMIIQRCSTYDKSTPMTGAVIGEPFRRGFKYSSLLGSPYECWMIPVVTTTYYGRLVHEDWYLADMGVVPYENGNFSHWNSQNYTLAVD